MPPFSSMSRSFNSRLREEATRRLRVPAETRRVSTHASVRRRRREKVRKMPTSNSFNSRLREEATPCISSRRARSRFQLTPP